MLFYMIKNFIWYSCEFNLIQSDKLFMINWCWPSLLYCCIITNDYILLITWWQFWCNLIFLFNWKYLTFLDHDYSIIPLKIKFIVIVGQNKDYHYVASTVITKNPSEPKWVNPNDIQYGFNSLRLEDLHMVRSNRLCCG